MLESSVKFFPAPAGETGRRPEDEEWLRRAHLTRWLSGHGAANEDPPCRHQGARLGPVGSQAPVHELDVEPSPGAQFSPAPRSRSGRATGRLSGTRRFGPARFFGLGSGLFYLRGRAFLPACSSPCEGRLSMTLPPSLAGWSAWRVGDQSRSWPRPGRRARQPVPASSASRARRFCSRCSRSRRMTDASRRSALTTSAAACRPSSTKLPARCLASSRAFSRGPITAPRPVSRARRHTRECGRGLAQPSQVVFCAHTESVRPPLTDVQRRARRCPRTAW